MADRTVAGSLQLKADWDLGEDNWKDDMDANLVKLSVLGMPVALDLVSATPGSPSEGDVYLFDDTHPTQANDVAVYDEGAWVYYSPVEGWMCYDTANAVLRQFDGAVWAEFTSGGGGGGLPAGGTLGQTLIKQSSVDDDADWRDPTTVLGGLIKIAEWISDGSVGTHTFSDIPEYYDDLIVVVNGRASAASDDTQLYMRFNGDTGNNYRTQVNFFTGGLTAFAGNSAIGDGISLPQITSATSTAAKASGMAAEIFAYANTTFHKQVSAKSSEVYTGSEARSQLNAGSWASVAAINSLTVYAGSSSNFEAGTKITVYARGGQVITNPQNMGMTGHMVLLDKIELGSAAASIDFQNISQRHDDLFIVLQARSDTAAALTGVLARFNNDSSAVYDYEDIHAYSSGTGFTQYTGQTSMYLGDIAAASADAGRAGIATLQIPFYSKTNFHKAARSDFSLGYGTGGFSQGAGLVGGTWRSAAAINRITLLPAAGNFEAGTIACVYGRGGMPGVATAKPWHWKPPLASDFTLVSGDGNAATVTNDPDAGLLFDGGAVVNSVRRAAYVTLSDETMAWEFIARVRGFISDASGSGLGLFMQDSVSGRQYAFHIRENSGFYVIAAAALSGAPASTPLGPIFPRTDGLDWLRIVHDGSSYTFYISANGKQWLSLGSVTNNAYLTNLADRVGFSSSYERSSGPKNMLAVEHWSLTGPGV